jgi:hypothetical protein
VKVTVSVATASSTTLEMVISTVLVESQTEAVSGQRLLSWLIVSLRRVDSLLLLFLVPSEIVLLDSQTT